MAGRRDRIFQIAVIGMSGQTQVRGDRGVGKSCLCNRFMKPHADDYYTEHINVISQSDFSGRIVNNDHFIYWGQSQKMSEGHEGVFRIVEQTEFIDDSSFTPLRGSVTKTYFKRCAETKLSSPEKLMYICKDQVGDDLGYEQVLLPDGKFQVDGFVLVFDVSRVRNRTLEQQVEFVTKLHQTVHKTKKPIILVATKCDNAEEVCMRECKQLANKLKLTLVETSAALGVNVELPFQILAAQIDRSRSKPREISFADANRRFTDQLKTATDQYLDLLTREVTDYHNVFNTKKKIFENGEVYKRYIALAGTVEAKKQFRNHTKRLKQAHQQMKMEQYFSHLPDALREIFPDLESIAGRDWAACRDSLPQHFAFHKWFITLNEPWEESEYINSEDELIPDNLLTSKERRAENIFLDHVNQLNAAKRKERMKEDFKHLLSKMSDVILPGSNFHVVKEHLDQQECYKELQDQERVEIFLKHQQEISQKAKEDFLELLLEKSNLFMSFNREGNLDEHLQDLQEELARDARFQALSEMEPDRFVMLLKYLAFTHSPVTDSCFMLDQEACMDREIEQTLDRSVQKTPVQDSLGKWSNTNRRLQLLILGEDGLAEELASEIRNLSIDDEILFGDVMYSLEVRTVDSDIIQAYNHFSTDFSPQGCICVFTSLQSFQYIKSNLEKTSLVDNVDDDAKPLRNLPVTLMFGRDSSIPESDFSALREEAQSLANRISDCEIVDTIEGGNFFQNKNFNENQIHKAYHFMIPLMNERARWVESIQDPEGTVLKLRVVMMCGDPYSPDFILTPLIKENTCYRTPNVKDCISVEMFIETDRRKVDVEVLSYHQALLRHKDVTHAYILVYSAKRNASLEVLNTFLKRLPRIPVMMVAVSEKLFAKQNSDYLVREGNKLADSTPNVKFLTAGVSFPAQTLAYSTFLKEAYSKRQDSERIHNDLYFRKLPTPPQSPLTPSERGDASSQFSDDDNSDVVFLPSKPTTQPIIKPLPPPRAFPPPPDASTLSQDHPPSSGHSVLHDRLVKPSDLRKRQNSKELYDVVNPPSYPSSTVSPRVSSSSDDIPSPLYAQINKPHRRFGSVKAVPTRPDPGPWVLQQNAKDSSLYAQVSRPPAVAPRRGNSFHTSRGYNTYAELEPPPHRRSREGHDDEGAYSEVNLERPMSISLRPPMPLPNDIQNTEGWQDNVAYGVTPIVVPPPPATEAPQPPLPHYHHHHPSPYGVVQIFDRHEPAPDKTEMVENQLYDSVGAQGQQGYSRPPPRQKPPVKPRPKVGSSGDPPDHIKKLDPAKYQHLDQTLSQGPSNRVKVPYQVTAVRTPEKDDGAGYSMPQDAIRVGTGVYAQPVDAIASGQNQRVRTRQTDKSSPKSTPTHPPSDKPRTKKKNQDKKHKHSEMSEQEKNDRFIEELNKLMGQAVEDTSITKGGRAEGSQTLKESKKQKKQKEQKKKQKKQKVKVRKPKGHLREMHLEELAVGELGVPPFIAQCTAFIEKEGLTSEGIYRTPGKTQDIEDILSNFDEVPNFNLETMDVTINAVASAIKHFFKSLPEPILPRDMQRELLDKYNQMKEDEFDEELYICIHSIHEKRFAVLKFMMYHLERIMQQSDENRMTADNISTCWWPSMLHPRSQSFEDLAIEAQLANIFRLLIEKTDFFFGEKMEEEDVPEDVGDTQYLLGDQTVDSAPIDL